MTSQIDLSKYVGKKVRVTFRGMDDKQDVIIEKKNRSTTYPYFIHGTALTYTSEGANNGYMLGPYDIIHIEEIQMNNYQKLENTIKEMQAEIDRLLKAQEQKEVRSFRNEIRKVLIDCNKIRGWDIDFFIDRYTDKICEIVESYIPVVQIEREDYDHGYNDALYKVKKNLGLIK